MENISELIHWKFEQLLKKKDTDKQNITQSTLLVIYMLSFLFCHLSRYKMDIWIYLLECEEKNISFFIKYFLKYAKLFFIKRLFSDIYLQEPNKYK